MLPEQLELLDRQGSARQMATTVDMLGRVLDRLDSLERRVAVAANTAETASKTSIDALLKIEQYAKYAPPPAMRPILEKLPDETRKARLANAWSKLRCAMEDGYLPQYLHANVKVILEDQGK